MGWMSLMVFYLSSGLMVFDLSCLEAGRLLCRTDRAQAPYIRALLRCPRLFRALTSPVIPTVCSSRKPAASHHPLHTITEVLKPLGVEKSPSFQPSARRLGRVSKRRLLMRVTAQRPCCRVYCVLVQQQTGWLYQFRRCSIGRGSYCGLK
jgi:hypothetical protein